jgi:hypothetical protein
MPLLTHLQSSQPLITPQPRWLTSSELLAAALREVQTVLTLAQEASL